MMSIRMNEGATGTSVLGWRCLLCGEAIDPGIEGNRKGNYEPEPERSRARPQGTLTAKARRVQKSRH